MVDCRTAGLRAPGVSLRSGMTMPLPTRVSLPGRDVVCGGRDDGFACWRTADAGGDCVVAGLPGVCAAPLAVSENDEVLSAAGEDGEFAAWLMAVTAMSSTA